MISEDDIYEVISKNISELRQKHPVTEEKITQAKLAEAIGIKRATLTNIEKGNQRAPIYVIYRICDYFSVGLDAILPNVSEFRKNDGSTEIGIGSDTYTLPSKAGALLNRVRARR